MLAFHHGILRRLVVPCVALATACGGSTTTNQNDESSETSEVSDLETDDEKQVASEAFLEEYLGDTCAALRECCAASGLGFDEEQCAEEVTPPAAHAVERFDPQAAAACLAQSTSCQQPAAFQEAPCLEVYAGDVPPGGECTSFVQCAAAEAGSITCHSGGTLAGTCMVRARVALGDACNATCEDLSGAAACTYLDGPKVDGRYCFVDDGGFCDSTGICRALPGAGESCKTYCDPDSYCSGGLCVPAGGPGSTCARSTPCGEGLDCSDAGVCEPLTAIGEGCESDYDCASESCFGGVCVDDKMDQRLNELCVPAN